MFTKDNLEEIKTTIANHFPNPKFLVMFVGVVIGPSMLLVTGARVSQLFGQMSNVWSLLALALLMFVSIGSSLLLFRRAQNPARNTPIKQR